MILLECTEKKTSKLPLLEMEPESENKKVVDLLPAIVMFAPGTLSCVNFLPCLFWKVVLAKFKLMELISMIPLFSKELALMVREEFSVG